MPTLAQALSEDRVPFDILHKSYSPVLGLVDVLIGVVPNCDMYLEIWKPGFRTYNLIVPNFLNLPHLLAGRSAPKDLVGLGMYTSSRAAGCAYCSAHCCSFALRRGSSESAVTGESRTPAEAAVAALAEGLSTVPHSWDPTLDQELERHLSPGDAEWVVMGIAMMGFLNKFMDALGVELEAAAVGDVSALISPTGWSVGQHDWADPTLADATGGLPPVDSSSSLAKVIRNAPGAVRLERQWMDGMPKDGPSARKRLRETYNYDEELLTQMLHTKPRRALAAMLRHNLDPQQSVVGIGEKALASLVYANHMNNEWLAAKSRLLAASCGISSKVIAAVDAAVDLTESAVEFTDRIAAVVAASLAMAPSPSVVDPTTIKTVTDHLGSDEIVELAVWISIAQLQHRLSLWYSFA